MCAPRLTRTLERWVVLDTEAEEDKFFDDALFLATNLTDGQTFFDVLPLLNFWAGFSPSIDVCDADDSR